jgi:hypothetical protein
MSHVIATRIVDNKKFYLLSDHSTMEVVFDGGELLPRYDSSSSWDAVEQYYRIRCLVQHGRGLSDESPECTEQNASPPPASKAVSRKTHQTLSPARSARN